MPYSNINDLMKDTIYSLLLFSNIMKKILAAIVQLRFPKSSSLSVYKNRNIHDHVPNPSTPIKCFQIV